MKKAKIFKILLVLMLPLVSIFFPILSMDMTDASISAVSGNTILLVGKKNEDGYYKHYFDNLSNAEAVESGEYEYYSIAPNSGVLLGKKSSGYSEFNFTPDMQALVNQGAMYVYATFDFDLVNDNDQSKIKVNLSSIGSDSNATESTEVTATGDGSFKTNAIKVNENNTKVRFSFETLASTQAGKYSKFTLSIPTLHFFTQISSITFEDESKTDEPVFVKPGQNLPVKATNEVTACDDEILGNFLVFSKAMHKISYKLSEKSEQFATIVKESNGEERLYVRSDAPQNAQIEIIASAYKKSEAFGGDYGLVEKKMVYTVSSQMQTVKVETDFENPASILGEGNYEIGKRVTLRVANILPGFTFESWYINGVKDERGRTSIIVTVEENLKVEAKFVKTIKIASVYAEKIYNGTLDALPSTIQPTFDGLEKGHSLGITGLAFQFDSADAGENRHLTYRVEDVQNCTLTGKDVDIYKLDLSSTQIETHGKIFKKESIISTDDLEVEYGDFISISFTASGLIEGDSLTGALSFEGDAKTLGKHKITLGNLPEKNSNYSFSFDEENFVNIIKRKLKCSFTLAEEKFYDGTADVKLNVILENTVDGDDILAEVSDAQFAQSDAGNNIEVLINKQKITLSGLQADKYVIDSIESFEADIKPRQLTIKVEEGQSFVYGDAISLVCNSEQLLEGDLLEGELTLNKIKEVGTHSSSEDISFEDILAAFTCGENYQITYYQPGDYQITAKSVVVNAEAGEKIFGESDPVFSYSVEGMLEGDELEGALTRESGENAGEYQILIGNLSNKNYDITFNSNIFTISKREVEVVITFLDKIYDGNSQVPLNVSFINAVDASKLNLILEANFASKDVGENQEILYNNLPVVTSEEAGYAENHTFTFTFTNISASITRRSVKVVISSASKIYGEADPEILFEIEGKVEGEMLVGKPKRNEGEGAGNYSYSLDSLNNENNPNYDISMVAQPFVINKREIVLTSEDAIKIFGEKDPIFTMTLSDETPLAFNENLEDVVKGILSREEGDLPGRYKIITDTLEISSNYQVYISENYLEIIKKEVSVVVEKASKVYGDENPVYGYVVLGEVENYPLSMNIYREEGENVGEYQLLQGTFETDCYIITSFTSNVLTILPSEITIQAESKIKVYGDDDPYFSIIITDGLLKNDDTILSVMQGQLSREEGETVGVYEIGQGDMTLGNNYNLMFLPANLEIIKQAVTIEAVNSSKIYGNNDLGLSFKMTSGQLKFGDQLSGKLEREAGENVGVYKILQGSLAINDNYEITFISGDYEIIKRQIEICPNVQTIVYGEDEDFSYHILRGTILEGDVIEGGLSREDADNKNAGRYRFISTLSNENYEIVFGEYYLKISPKEVKIYANSVEIEYGQPEQELTFVIENDPDDQLRSMISGEIYRTGGNNAGAYDIRSSLTLGRNYIIKFTSAKYTIKPIQLIIESQSYNKVYGAFDPEFEYKIISGQLLDGDRLFGSISREVGEDAGEYKLINNLSNPNYDIKFDSESYRLVITRKKAKLLAGIYDKPYDGTSKAVIKTPVVTGLIDKDVKLKIDKENDAVFAGSAPGNNIPVIFNESTIVLVGDKAKNYILELPTDITANIAYRELKNKEVSISSPKDANLYYGLELEYENFEISRKEMGLHIQRVLKAFDIYLTDGQNKAEVATSVTVTISLPEEISSLNNLYVYHKNSEGKYVLISSRRNEDGNLVITTDELGEFVIMSDNDAWIEIAAFICAAVLLLVLIIALIVLGVKKNKARKTRKIEEQKALQAEKQIQAEESQSDEKDTE